jgi:two-component system response regulator FlrC
MGNILIVDDEEQMRLALEAVLNRLGHKVLKAENGEQALEILAQSMSAPQIQEKRGAHIDFVISDMKMPVMDGLTLLGKVKALYPQIPIAMITAYGSIGQAVEVMRSGAFDFITKPFSGEDLENLINRVTTSQKQLAQVAQSKPNRASKNDRSIITNDPMFRKVLEIASVVAESNAGVLIQGESGTGKELVARFIHTASPRRNHAFVAVNCAALPENLLESELFGHEKGAFTGAINTKIGKFEQAEGGTILLDEISEMNLALQAKLLRILQEREVDRVGGTKPVAVDVRVLATTNRDLRQYVAQGKFREDLFYRLNVIPLYIPALRERSGDVRLLTEYFVRIYSKGATKVVSKELIKQLEAYPWRGNVRELQNACERAVLLSMNDELKFEHFILSNNGSDEDSSCLSQAIEKLGSISALDGNNLSLYAGLSVAEAEKMLINETLKFTDNNKTKAAEMLGISIRTLRNKLQEYGNMS